MKAHDRHHHPCWPCFRWTRRSKRRQRVQARRTRQRVQRKSRRGPSPRRTRPRTSRRRRPRASPSTPKPPSSSRLSSGMPLPLRQPHPQVALLSPRPPPRRRRRKVCARGLESEPSDQLTDCAGNGARSGAGRAAKGVNSLGAQVLRTWLVEWKHARPAHRWAPPTVPPSFCLPTHPCAL